MATTQPAAKKATSAAVKRAPVKRAVSKVTKVIAKPIAKSIAKPVAKKAPVAKSVVARTSPAVKKAVAKPTKEKKPKLVRDSFTFPKAEYEVLEAMKQRAAKLKVTVKKTELLRAGIKSLASLSDAAFLSAIAAVPSLKTGRPAKS